MGMCVGLTTVSDPNIDRIMETPALVWAVIAPDEPGILVEALGTKRTGGILSRLFGRGIDPPKDPLPTLDLVDGEGHIEDLDKAWHALHYFFTGTVWEGDPPLNFLVSGGTEVDGIDVGYGPPRVFSSLDVHEIKRALEPFNREALLARYDVEDMTKKDIYPTIWQRDDEREENFEYCFDYFEVINRFLAVATRHDLGMLVSIQ